MPKPAARPRADELVRLARLVAASDRPKKRISPETRLPLTLTERERELLLEKSLASDELTRRLRVVPPREKPVVVRYTLEELDELGGFVAFESNHAENRKLYKEWLAI